MEALKQRERLIELVQSLPDDKIASVLQYVEEVKDPVTDRFTFRTAESEEQRKERIQAALAEGVGLWKDRKDMTDVDGYIRTVRRGRRFDF